MQKDYICSFCGKRHIKLWHPYMETEPLICAECAEKFQAPWKYEKNTWRKEGTLYIGIPSGGKFNLPKWKVNNKGKVPSYYGIPGEMTDKLIVDISKFSPHKSKYTIMVPACPDKNGLFLEYTSISRDIRNWWENLPTR